MSQQNYYRKCSACKKEIDFNYIYQICSVSTCKKNVYCSVDCWNIHVPILNHKSAWAEETRSPSKSLFLSQQDTSTPKRRIVISSSSKASKNNTPEDILIVASKLKLYIKSKGEMNMAGNVLEILSNIVRRACDEAIYEARAEGRKTVMNRDFK